MLPRPVRSNAFVGPLRRFADWAGKLAGAVARIAGLRVDYPEDLLREPKSWLNHIAKLNPQLGAEEID